MGGIGQPDVGQLTVARVPAWPSSAPAGRRGNQPARASGRSGTAAAVAAAGAESATSAPRRRGCPSPNFAPGVPRRPAERAGVDHHAARYAEFVGQIPAWRQHRPRSEPAERIATRSTSSMAADRDALPTDLHIHAQKLPRAWPARKPRDSVIRPAPGVALPRAPGEPVLCAGLRSAPGWPGRPPAAAELLQRVTDVGRRHDPGQVAAVEYQRPVVRALAQAGQHIGRPVSGVALATSDSGQATSRSVVRPRSAGGTWLARCTVTRPTVWPSATTGKAECRCRGR